MLFVGLRTYILINFFGFFFKDSSTITLQSWLQRNDMANGKLLSSGFKGIAMLSQFSGKKIDEEKIKGYILKINFFFPFR